MTGRFLRVIEFLDQNFLIMTDTYFAVPSVFRGERINDWQVSTCD